MQDAPHFRPLVLKAVELAGSQSILAEKIGRSQQQVSALCTRASSISAEDALAIHWATKGKVPASSMRPDLWVNPDDVPSAPAEQGVA
jgi:DNA-binding transcriptional regulator YdaS (Cro superfamily)